MAQLLCWKKGQKTRDNLSDDQFCNTKGSDGRSLIPMSVSSVPDLAVTFIIPLWKALAKSFKTRPISSLCDQNLVFHDLWDLSNNDEHIDLYSDAHISGPRPSSDLHHTSLESPCQELQNKTNSISVRSKLCIP